MAIQTSGQIAMSDIMTELNISGQTALNDADVRGLIDKSSGAQMSMSEWYGAADAFSFNITGDTNRAVLSTLATAAGWDGSKPVIATINSGVTLYTDSRSYPGLTVDVANATIENNGRVTGRGGSANTSEDGSEAMKVTASGVTVNNNANAFIAGGGGAGGSGSGSGGGAGQSPVNTASSTPSSSATSYICAGVHGCCATYGSRHVASGANQGGNGTTSGNIANHHCCSAPNGAVLCASGVFYFYATGSDGGSILSAATNADGSSSRGGGGWGRPGKGSSPGAGGKAINYNGNSVTLSNSGTLYGATS